MTKYSKCVVGACGHQQHRNKECIYARFPKDIDRCRKWLKAVGDDDLVLLPPEKLHNIRYVCGCHFANDQFGNPSRKRLKKTAVPTLFDSSTKPLSDDAANRYPLSIDAENVPAIAIDVHENVPMNITSEGAVLLESQVSPAVDVTDEQPILESPAGSVITWVASSITDDIALSFGAQQTTTAEPVTVELMPLQDVSNEQSDLKRRRSSAAGERISCKKRMELIGMPGEPISPRKAKLLRIINQQEVELKNKIACLRNRNDALKALSTENDLKGLISRVSSPVLRSLIVADIRNNKRPSTGRRWSMDDKMLAVSLYKRGPKAYSYLQHLMPLPSARTIARLLHTIPMDVGINARILKHFTKIVPDMSSKDKQCILMFDEIALKKRLIYNRCAGVVDGFEDFAEHGRTPNIADHSLVFMVQGLNRRFKFPVAYYICKGTTSASLIHQTLVDVVKALNGVGLNVAATVCDQGPTNRKALSMLQSNGGKPGPWFELDGRTVYTLFDPPHLLKSIRNNFMGNFYDWSKKNERAPVEKYPGQSVRWKNQVAKWRDIIHMYNMDRTMYRFNKLSRSHLFPTSKEKMRVKYAAQALSNTTAAILRCMCSSDDSSIPGGLETAQFVGDMDLLFDSINGPANKKDRKKNQRDLVTKTSNHDEIWSQFEKYIDEMEFINVAGKSFRPPCQNGMLSTLSAMRALWNDLQANGFEELNLRHLNQDPLENLFGVIRQQGVTSDNPTTGQFVAALKSTIISKLSAPHSRSGNCQQDDGEMMEELLTYFMHGETGTQLNSTSGGSDLSETHCSSSEESDGTIPVLHIADDEGPEDVLFQENLHELSEESVIYIAGYVKRSLMKRMECPTCLAAFDHGAENNFKSEEVHGCSLVATVRVAQKLFTADILHQLHLANIKCFAMQTFMSGCDVSWLTCNEHASSVSLSLFSILIQLFIETECRKLNQPFKTMETAASNAAKIAQQCTR